MYKRGYLKFIPKRFELVDKNSKTVSFVPNNIQQHYLENGTGRDVILKARQQGFSSLILAIFTTDFILKENTRSVIVADESDNAAELLERVKYYIQSYEHKTGSKVPLKYNSKYELHNEAINSKYTIGTAKNAEFGRSKTITNLHLSEFAFYRDPERLFAGAMQAVVPSGRVVIESTANGFNYFKSFWDDCVAGERPFNPMFYKASGFYSPEFLEMKKAELKRTFKQEYPETPEEAFLTSGDLYFDSHALQSYLKNAKDPIKEGTIYV